MCVPIHLSNHNLETEYSRAGCGVKQTLERGQLRLESLRYPHRHSLSAYLIQQNTEFMKYTTEHSSVQSLMHLLYLIPLSFWLFGLRLDPAGGRRIGGLAVAAAVFAMANLFAKLL